MSRRTYGSGMICTAVLSSLILTDTSWKPRPLPLHLTCCQSSLDSSRSVTVNGESFEIIRVQSN